MKSLLKKPYIFWVIGIFLTYMVVNIYISQFYVTVQYIPYYLSTINWSELILGTILSLIIGILISINTVYTYVRYKERKNYKAEGALTCAATVGGLATGVCSACVAGLMPLIFSLLGFSFSWGALPFKGMEIQLLVIVVLGLGLYWNTKSKIPGSLK
ncbi:MAG TPA: hypothetical protein VI564_05180 [Candidatus Nanoarchaeia archaeon]|nr:hypothetical protein [Candidatus Nanoarchaeia archaeon]